MKHFAFLSLCLLTLSVSMVAGWSLGWVIDHIWRWIAYAL